MQHQYKLYPAPEPPVQLRHNVEDHRYEDVDDSPPRYSNLNISDTTNNLLTFDETPEKQNNSQYYNMNEFDPFAPIPTNSSTGIYSFQLINFAKIFWIFFLSIAIEHRYEEIAEDIPTPSPSCVAPQRQLSSQTLPNIELYFAAYPFKALDKNQLNLEFGQPVVVEHKCDLTGNSEWWFVLDREGNSGYVPANYLTKQSIKHWIICFFKIRINLLFIFFLNQILFWLKIINQFLHFVWVFNYYYIYFRIIIVSEKMSEILVIFRLINHFLKLIFDSFHYVFPSIVSYFYAIF